MDNFKSFKSVLPGLNVANADDIALSLFRFQVEYNLVYREYLDHLNVNPASVSTIYDIPFLPVSLFKNHILKTGEWKEETIFHSSGTTGKMTSRHFIAEKNFYLEHAERCFTTFFGPLSQYHFMALMPSYLEQENSSLIAMLNSFIEKSGSPDSGFYLYDYDKLLLDVNRLKEDSSRKIVLWGVSFALLDLAEKFSPDLKGCLVFETGGMKGRREELTRSELHRRLTQGLNVEVVYSEYGMTELLSQAYTKGGSVFYTPAAMKIVVRDIWDPFEKGLVNRAGGINIIDLANIHSVAFIETEDVGKIYDDGSFEITGRLDNSDIRGCNLMVE